MSWRLILSEYPESLFRDSSALLVLALLERRGAQTEADLAHQTKAEGSELAKALFALHRDRCIEYTRDFVRVTERGRDFIDRVSLQDEIIDDLLNDMQVGTEEKPKIRDVLLMYRSRSFPSYIDSITAIRTWNQACRVSFLGGGKERNTRDAGARAILLRDLRKWFVTAGINLREPETEKKPNTAQKMMIIGHSRIGKTNLTLSALQVAGDWVEICDNIDKANNPKEYLRQLDSPHLVVFFTHQFSRNLEDFGTWVHNWTAPEGKWFAILNACHSAEEFARSAEKEGEIAAKLSARHWSELVEKEVGYPRLLSRSLGDILTFLLFAESVTDLAIRTNSDEEVLRQILENIQSKCESLIGTEDSTSPSAKERAEIGRKQAGARTYGNYASHLAGVDPIPYYSGPEAFLHCPAERLDLDFFTCFSLEKSPQFNLSNLAQSLKEGQKIFKHKLGTVHIFFKVNTNEILIRLEGSDKLRVEKGLDSLEILIKMDNIGQVAFIGFNKGIGIDNLTRSTMAILLEKSGFKQIFPDLHAALECQFALKKVTPNLEIREMHAYQINDITFLENLIKEKKIETAKEEIAGLFFSKSQEIRRLALGYMEYMHGLGDIDNKIFQTAQQFVLREDVLEDLTFIERSFKNDIDGSWGFSSFVKETFKNLFHLDVDRKSLAGSLVKARYFARGCNKQIYIVKWRMPDGESRQFAVGAIRDAQLGQGDFDETRIKESINNWRQLSLLGCTDVVKYGSTVWHIDWRQRQLEMNGTYGNVLRIIKNNFLLMSREFVEDGTPLNLFLVSDTPEHEKKQAIEAAAMTYLRVWFVSKRKGAFGMYFSTPRAEDIIIRRGIDGEFYGTIVDPDTLYAEGSLQMARRQFGSYPYYNEEMLDRVVSKLEKQFFKN